MAAPRPRKRSMDPRLLREGTRPVVAECWGVWRWLGPDEEPPACWWFIMEAGRNAAFIHASMLRTSGICPVAYAAKVQMGRLK